MEEKMEMKIKKGWIVMAAVVMAIAVPLAYAAIPDAVSFKITNTTHTVFVVDKLGNVNISQNMMVNYTLRVLEDIQLDGSLNCTNCINDAAVSNVLTASDLVSGSSVVSDGEVDNDLTLTGGSMDLETTTFSNLMGFTNLTICADNEIMKIDTDTWVCEADAEGAGGTDTNASTACSGTTTYLDGEGNCDDIAPVYVDVGGDTMTANLTMGSATSMANISLSTGPGERGALVSNSSSSSIWFDDDGAIIVHLEAA